MKRLRFSVAGLVLVASVASTGSPAVATADPIQPGDYIQAPPNGVIGPSRCTLNFVYDGTGPLAGEVYIATAAQCVGGVGAPVRLVTGEVFGQVAFMGEANIPSWDFAFIAVLTSHVGRVSPAVKGHPQYPTGIADPAGTDTGDLVQFSGQGSPFDVTTPTQEQRVGVLVQDGATRISVLGALAASESSSFAGLGPVVSGDTGGPIVHIETGTAAGVVGPKVASEPTTFCCHTGPTVPRMINLAAADGFTVAMRTVGG